MRHFTVVLTDDYTGAAEAHQNNVQDDILDLTSVFCVENVRVLKNERAPDDKSLTLDLFCDHDFAGMVANTQGVKLVKVGCHGPVVEPKVM